MSYAQKSKWNYYCVVDLKLDMFDLFRRVSVQVSHNFPTNTLCKCNSAALKKNEQFLQHRGFFLSSTGQLSLLGVEVMGGEKNRVGNAENPIDIREDILLGTVYSLELAYSGSNNNGIGDTYGSPMVIQIPSDASSVDFININDPHAFSALDVDSPPGSFNVKLKLVKGTTEQGFFLRGFQIYV